MVDSSPSLQQGTNLIAATIRPREETYYLVTEDTLNGIKEKSLASDIFMLITSLLFGAFFSVLITLKASMNLPAQTVSSLNIYQWAFFGFGVLFLVLTIVNIIMKYRTIGRITKYETSIGNADEVPPKTRCSRPPKAAAELGR